MYAALLAAAAVAAFPTPSGSNNTVVGLYYDHQADQAVSFTTSATTAIKLASWRLTDGTLCSALAVAASRGVAVQVAYDGTSGTNDAQYQATAPIRASGGTVYACSFPRHIANNFLTGDSRYTLQGNYYYSPTAVQIGSYTMAVSGTGTAAECSTVFTTLISGGTITALDEPPAAAPVLVSYIDDCGPRTTPACNACTPPPPPQTRTPPAGCEVPLASACSPAVTACEAAHETHHPRYCLPRLHAWRERALERRHARHEHAESLHACP
jgi:hypothetical protein